MKLKRKQKKHPFTGVLQKSYSEKLLKTCRKTLATEPILETLELKM